ncbi:SdpI family protein [Saccharopolyspora sp. CA-218241]|uniref:SdpI family protein n=1 Tax=Saccharopolyspora sp. CA-218241 TaxID=3240027 RepID=UPI003D98E914
MLAVQVILCALLLVGGIALLYVGLRGWRGRLARNRFVGVRTPAALRGEEAFALANRVAAPANIAGGRWPCWPGSRCPRWPRPRACCWSVRSAWSVPWCCRPSAG